MKLAVSNIAWETTRMDEHLAILADEGCDGLELSASSVWPEPISVCAGDLDAFKKKVFGLGLRIPSMHSLTYTRPDLTFFESDDFRRDLVGYVVSLARVASVMECPLMVFGSAKSRAIGERDRAMCYRIMADVFRRIAERAAPLGVTVIIEALGRNETDSINNMSEAMGLVRMVGHPNFSLHLDLKSSFAEGEDIDAVWRDYGREIRHCHVADPGLLPPSSACPHHVPAARAMRNAGYGGTISIEMKKCPPDTVTQLKSAIDFVRKTYLNG